MIPLLKSKVGIACLIGFTIMMALALHSVVERRRQRSKAAAPAIASPRSQPTSIPVAASPKDGDRSITTSSTPNASDGVQQNAAYLDDFYGLVRQHREDRDRLGNALTRRPTPPAVSQPAHSDEHDDSAPPPRYTRSSLRFQSRPAPMRGDTPPTPTLTALPPAVPGRTSSPQGPAVHASGRPRPRRFNPYGRVIKCELVFTLDSTNEQTPFVALVMEPVYNNGELVIPAGAEFHGSARPDRLRDRIFSGTDWVLVFPRETGRPNGRQLNVHGVALNRVEPDANGMTWGITDGSYGLQGRVIRTLDSEEIKRFVATFLAAGSVALQDRQSDRTGQESVRNTPQNAVLQGLASNFQKMADDISKEIAEHGVFIRVPAGHQFYFYPMQIIDPDAADISSDVANVR